MREPKIVFETPGFLALDKPAGLIVHHPRSRRTDELSLIGWVLARYPEVRTVGDDPEERPGIVHRLDKETSGLILVARTQASFEYLKRQFRERRIQKTYLAVVRGKLRQDKGVIDRPIGIKDGSVKRSVHSSKMKKEALTEYEVRGERSFADERFSLLAVHPKTGRTHQIRVHLASIGHPIAGDGLYGGKDRHSFGRMMLHAWQLEFAGLKGEMLHLETGTPPEFKEFFTT